MKNVIKLANYYSPEEFERSLSEFIDYYNNKRYHESLDNLTPVDIYLRRSQEILNKRKQTKHLTLKNRRKKYLEEKIIINNALCY